MNQHMLLIPWLWSNIDGKFSARNIFCGVHAVEVAMNYGSVFDRLHRIISQYLISRLDVLRFVLDAIYCITIMVRKHDLAREEWAYEYDYLSTSITMDRYSSPVIRVIVLTIELRHVEGHCLFLKPSYNPIMLFLWSTLLIYLHYPLCCTLLSQTGEHRKIGLAHVNT